MNADITLERESQELGKRFTNWAHNQNALDLAPVIARQTAAPKGRNSKAQGKALGDRPPKPHQP